MFFEVKTWKTDELAQHLENAGIRRGQNVIMHSSLKSIGKTEKGPETVVDAVLSVIGPEANLLVPTFTYSLPGWKGDPFDLEKSAARTGAIPEYIRKRGDAVRSFHPTHSVAVIGPDKDEIIANHLDATPLGVGSPFSRMLDRDATILMLGTRQDTNSSLHLCEVMANLPYINVPFSENTDFEVAWFNNSEGQIEFVPVREVPGCSRGFRAIEPKLQAREILRSCRIGNASCQVLVMRELVDAALEILTRDPTLLLCRLGHCAICPKRRTYMQSLK